MNSDFYSSQEMGVRLETFDQMGKLAENVFVIPEGAPSVVDLPNAQASANTFLLCTIYSQSGLESFLKSTSIELLSPCLRTENKVTWKRAATAA